MISFSRALSRRLHRQTGRSFGVIEVCVDGQVRGRVVIPLTEVPISPAVRIAHSIFAALSFSTAFANKVLDAFGNAGSGFNFDSGTLELRTGAAPGPDAAATGTVVVTITLPADAFGAGASKSMAKAGTWQDTSADSTNTPAHFRLRQSGDSNGATGSTDERIEGTVGQGSGDLSLDNTSIVAGQTVTINTFTFSLP